MNNFFKFGLIAFILAGCGTNRVQPWDIDYESRPATTPTQIQYGAFSEYGTYTDGAHKMAVLLPLSGQNAPIGQSIQKSIEIALLQTQPNEIYTHFYDTSANPETAIEDALNSDSEIIIGPVFADDARTIRNKKTSDIPVLSFTSDATAVGNGVISVALMPSNSIEAIVAEMPSDNVHDIIVVAPDTDSGHLMAGASLAVARPYNIGISGIFYYRPGDSESIKATMETASMAKSRRDANNAARGILSDILTNETLPTVERSSLANQLNKLSKDEYLGTLPYNGVLFLGDANDSKSLASFLRYYNVDAHKVFFYGTALWDGTDIASDFTMSGAKYAALPSTNSDFAALYERLSGTQPDRLATLGYDATKIAMGSLFSKQSKATYLLNPSGFNGIDGIIRLKSNGDNERALRIMRLNASGTPIEVKSAKTNFITPIYKIEQTETSPTSAMELKTRGINPMDYIKIPDRFKGKYKSKTYGATISAPSDVSVITFVPSDSANAIIDSGFKPIKHESIKQTYIDSVEIEG